MHTVVITSKLLQGMPGRHLDLLQAAGFEVRYPPLPLLSTEGETLDALRGASAVIAGSEPYTERVLAALPELRVISRSGVGVDRIDLRAATRHGIAVAVVPNGNQDAVAEFTIGLILALAKSIVQLNQRVRRGEWIKPQLQPLRGKTLGLIGLGRIGRGVAMRAQALQLQVIAHDKLPDREFASRHGIDLVGLQELLVRSDYVSLHVPFTEETAGMIHRGTIMLMKPGSFLVNTARGGLVVEADLLEALVSGHLAGAGLDVFAEEPVQPDNPLLRLDNVLASPHIAASDAHSDEVVALQAAQNIVNLYRGIWPCDCIANPDVRSGWLNRGSPLERSNAQEG